MRPGPVTRVQSKIVFYGDIIIKDTVISYSTRGKWLGIKRKASTEKA
jgi:hypothetical protein